MDDLGNIKLKLERLESISEEDSYYVDHFVMPGIIPLYQRETFLVAIFRLYDREENYSYFSVGKSKSYTLKALFDKVKYEIWDHPPVELENKIFQMNINTELTSNEDYGDGIEVEVKIKLFQVSI